MSLPSPVFGSPVSLLPSHLSIMNTKNPKITHGRDPGVPQGMMSGGSWELSRGSEGRKNYSLCSLSSFSSGLRNAGTGESVKLQARPILQQGPRSEPPAEEELLQFKKGGGSLLCFTHREQFLVFTWGKWVSFTNPSQCNIHQAKCVRF